MRVLVTGSDGYIGQILVPMLQRSGHEVVGLDIGLFRDCSFFLDSRSPSRHDLVRRARCLRPIASGASMPCSTWPGCPTIRSATSIPKMTYDINHAASVRLARLAKASGVQRFVFASSCSNYGASGDDYLDEDAPFFPVTPYAESKVLVERDLHALADDTFQPHLPARRHRLRHVGKAAG